jgi:predicted nucleotidyltransferase
MIENSKINEIVKKIAQFYNPDKIILFGSYAYGIPNENSDLDLLIIKDSDMPRPERSVEIRKMLFGSMVPMDLLVYTNSEINESKDKKHSFVYQAITKGKTLYERKA